MNGMRIINPDAFFKAAKETDAGRFGVLETKDFEIRFSDTEPIEGFVKPDNFPDCCPFHRQVFKNATAFFDKFPNCCEAHKKLLKTRWFNKDDYKGIAEKIINTIVYTEYHITTQIDKENWYEDIAQYLEYSLLSFGLLPDGYGSVIGLEHYTKGITQWINSEKDIETEKKEMLIEFIDAYGTGKGASEKKGAFNLNILSDTYKKWLKIFPFGISYFRDLKQYFEKQFPVLEGVPEHNIYTGTTKFTPVTPERLTEILTNQTKVVLQTIATSQLLEDGIITDFDKHAIELLNESHRIKQSSLLEDFSKGEMKYIKVLKKWLSNEKSYFKGITPFLKRTAAEPTENRTPEQTKAAALKAEFEKLKFMTLPMINGKLTGKNIDALFSLLATKKTPYQIAMLHYLGFVDLVFQSNTKEKGYKLLSRLLSSKERVIKGNCLVLNVMSAENRTTYTSHLHISEVEKDYQNIKLG